jgi:VanZ family protein
VIGLQNEQPGWARQAFVFLWILFVIGLSLSPFDIKERLHTTGDLHDPGHYVAFAVTAGLLRGLQATFVRTVAVAVGAWSLGVIIEALQWTVYENALEWRDLGVNAIGVIIGTFIMYAVDVLRPAVKGQVQP